MHVHALEPLVKTSIVLSPADKCIYCGAANVQLSKEHVIALALNGRLILPKASCSKCAIITGRLELIVSRKMYRPLRLKRGFDSRTKKMDRPKTLRAAYHEAGVKTDIDLPVHLFPTNYITMRFPPPGIFTGAPLSDMNPDIQCDIKVDVREMQEAITAVGRDNLITTNEVHWGAFCRMLAKIAHAYLFAELREQGYEPLLPGLILGTNKFLSHYVGGGAEMPFDEAVPLSLFLKQIDDVFYLCVYIRLMEDRFPPYVVVAGRVTDLDAIQSVE